MSFIYGRLKILPLNLLSSGIDKNRVLMPNTLWVFRHFGHLQKLVINGIGSTRKGILRQETCILHEIF
jgi:hypothetical protein